MTNKDVITMLNFFIPQITAFIYIMIHSELIFSFYVMILIKFRIKHKHTHNPIFYMRLSVQKTLVRDIDFVSLKITVD